MIPNNESAIRCYNPARFAFFPGGQEPEIEITADVSDESESFNISVITRGNDVFFNRSSSETKVTFCSYPHEDLPTGHFITALANALTEFVNQTATNKEG